MSLHLAIAYRWGNTNDHWYFLYAGDDLSKANALAENERNGRGGKYGVAVYEVTQHGEAIEMRAYYGSNNEEEPTHNWRIDYFERLGHVLDTLIDGHLSVPNDEPDEHGMRCMRRVQVEVDPLLRAEVERHRKQREVMETGYLKARQEAEERAARIWCPICDSTPVYVVDYSASFWRVAREESSGEIEVGGLEGYWCRRCEQLHLLPEHIARNQHKIWMARHKAATAELEST